MSNFESAPRSPDTGIADLCRDIAAGGYTIHESSSAKRLAPRFRGSFILAAFAATIIAGTSMPAANACVTAARPDAADMNAYRATKPDLAELHQARRSLETKFGISFDEDSLRIAPAPTQAAPNGVNIQAIVCGRERDFENIRSNRSLIQWFTGADITLTTRHGIETVADAAPPRP